MGVIDVSLGRIRESSQAYFFEEIIGYFMRADNGDSSLVGLTIIEFKSFRVDASKLLTVDEIEDLKIDLAFDPEKGAIIPGTGGIRKLRIGIETKGKGKRGGGRVIYYYHSHGIPLALLAFYAKGEKVDLSADEKRDLRQLVGDYVAQFKK